MKCIKHGAEAIGVCTVCGRAVCEDCAVQREKMYCLDCAEEFIRSGTRPEGTSRAAFEGGSEDPRMKAGIELRGRRARARNVRPAAQRSRWPIWVGIAIGVVGLLLFGFTKLRRRLEEAVPVRRGGSMQPQRLRAPLDDHPPETSPSPSPTSRIESASGAVSRPSAGDYREKRKVTESVARARREAAEARAPTVEISGPSGPALRVDVFWSNEEGQKIHSPRYGWPPDNSVVRRYRSTAGAHVVAQIGKKRCLDTAQLAGALRGAVSARPDARVVLAVASCVPHRWVIDSIGACALARVRTVTFDGAAMPPCRPADLLVDVRGLPQYEAASVTLSPVIGIQLQAPPSPLIVVSIDKRGRAIVGGERCTLDALAGLIRTQASGRSSLSVLIRADKYCNSEDVSKVVALCARAGIRQIRFAVYTRTRR